MLNLFDLFVKIQVDDQASAQISKITTGLGKGVVDASKVALKAVAAVSAGVTALAGMSIKQYAEYEQLVGGVDTLFKSSSQKVQQYASEAFRTSGMSANQYMETVTSFSAALLKSVGGDTEKAAQLADTAITDMSDNANKMGVSLESLQNAYTGFSRGNFTMLDNLALGFSGTKEGMQELLDTAKELSGVKYDIGSYADIVEAIHIVQTEMGITGTTAKEAASTIQGSVGMMKAAWSNLMTSMADENADTSKTIDEFVDSVATVYDNIAPKAQVALNGVLDMAETLLPKLADSLPDVLNDFVPNLVKTAISIIRNLAQSIKNNAGEIVDAAKNVVFTFIDGVVDGLPDIIDAVNEIVDEVVDIIPDIAKKIVNAIPKIVTAVAKGLSEGSQKIVVSIAGWFTDIPDLAEKALDQFETLINSAVSYTDLVDDAASKTMNLADALSDHGRTISEIEDDIEDAEGKVTQIIADALKKQDKLRDQDIDSIKRYNEELRRIEQEKLSIYRDQQLAELRKAQYGLNAAETPEEIAEYTGKAQAALEASNQAVNDIYDAQLIAAENYYKSIGEVGTKAHNDELARIEEERKKELSVNQDYYNQTIGLVADQSTVLASNVLANFENLSKAAEPIQAMMNALDDAAPDWYDNYGLDWLTANEDIYRANDDFDRIYADYIDAVRSADYKAAQSVLSTAFEAKKGGQGIDDEMMSVIDSILDVYQEMPGTLGEVTKKHLLLLLEDVEEYIPSLQYASEMSVGEIKDLVEDYLNEGVAEPEEVYITEDQYVDEIGRGTAVVSESSGQVGQYGSSTVNGDININIDGAQHTDAQSLANAVASTLQEMFDRRFSLNG